MPAHDKIICEGTACVDCVVLLANGETDPNWSQASTDEYLARVAERNPAGTVTLGSIEHECRDSDGRIADECEEDNLGYSRRGCDVCGSSLAGDLQRVTFWEPESSVNTGPVVTDVTEGNVFIAGVGEVPAYTPATNWTAEVHADYPHEPGRLYDCSACEGACHCTAGNTECVYEGDHNGLAAEAESDLEL